MDTIVIVNIDSDKAANLIATRIREHNVYTETVDIKEDSSSQKKSATKHVKGYILTSSDRSILESAKDYKLPNYVLEAGVPILGIGYGMHALVNRLGGGINPKVAILGEVQLDVKTWSGYNFFSMLASKFPVQVSHTDIVSTLPKGFTSVASTPNCPNAVIADCTRDYYGFQFHPELSSQDFMRTFAIDICGCSPTWTMANYLKTQVTALRLQVMSTKVYTPLTTSRESLVAAALVQKAVGINARNVFIPTGIMRKNEVETLLNCDPKVLEIEVLNEVDLFPVLENCYTAREKYDVIEEKLVDVHSGNHNGEIVAVCNDLGDMMILETVHAVYPLKSLLPFEIEQLGRELGLPENLLTRQQIPLSELAHRCVGMITPDRMKILREADSIMCKALAKQKVTASHRVLLVPIESKETVVLYCSQPCDYRDISKQIQAELPAVKFVTVDITD